MSQTISNLSESLVDLQEIFTDTQRTANFTRVENQELRREINLTLGEIVELRTAVQSSWPSQSWPSWSLPSWIPFFALTCLLLVLALTLILIRSILTLVYPLGFRRRSHTMRSHDGNCGA